VSVEDPVITTCAISGALASRDQCPAIPCPPAEYAAEARRIAGEGGVMIHIQAVFARASRAGSRRPGGTSRRWPTTSRPARGEALPA
jgi:uncharacterized protein (DUF849 family)